MGADNRWSAGAGHGNTAARLIETSRRLAARVDRLRFSSPVAYVYNPLGYARAPYEEYLMRFGRGRKRVLFLGMNPGPWGMAQTGVPFGEVRAVKEWMAIEAPVESPKQQHKAKKIMGFSCPRSEVSGRRLWSLMMERFASAEQFFSEHFVANYCPLMFLETGGRNLTPERLPPEQKSALFRVCDDHLRELIDQFEPRWVIGVGRFAESRIHRVSETFRHRGVDEGGILHPSPASPNANRDWAGKAEKQLVELGVWNA